MLVTADPAIVDAVESVAATYGITVGRIDVPEGVGRFWRQPRVVLVGDDLAAAVAAASHARRDRVYLVGFDAAGLGTWSMSLGAEVIPLPQGTASLSAILSQDADGRAPVAAVLGGSGGVGASTLAAGLALGQARRAAAALVDLDPLGGGLDLLMGVETGAGHRWPRLMEAAGEVGDMRGLLPEAEGVAVLSMAREGAAAPTPAATSAITGSLARHHGLVVVDCGRHPSAAARTMLRVASAIVVVSGGSVRGVAACVQQLQAWDVRTAGLVVRRQPGVRVPPEVVAETLGLELWGVVPHDPALITAAEAGDPPWRSGSAWSRAVNRVLQRVLVSEDADVG